MSRLLRATSALGAALAAALLLAASPALAAKKPLAPADRIDLNRAGVAELMRLPGVGEKKAQAIVALRTRQPFRKPEDVVAVKGLGPAWFAKVKGWLVVGPPAGAASAPADLAEHLEFRTEFAGEGYARVTPASLEAVALARAHSPIFSRRTAPHQVTASAFLRSSVAGFE